jgi:hypothetical protein
MANRGTRELKRKQWAAPSPERHPSWGCLSLALVYVATCLVLFARTGWLGFIVVVIPVLLGVAYAIVRYIYGVILLVFVSRRWAPEGVRCLLVHSDSPVWGDHIRSQWLPSFGHLARVLNWSERATWAPSLELRVFRRFCFAQYNFNPAVLVFRGLRSPLAFRFFYAFHEAKQGRPQYLQGLEIQMFAALGVPRGGPTRG